MQVTCRLFLGGGGVNIMWRLWKHTKTVQNVKNKNREITETRDGQKKEEKKKEKIVQNVKNKKRETVETGDEQKKEEEKKKKEEETAVEDEGVTP